MNGLIVTIVIVVGMSVLGWLTQALKRAADRRTQEQERERLRQRRATAAQAVANPTTQNELDRYIRAVEAQRAAALPTARSVPRAQPVPTMPVARPRPADLPTAFPAAKTRGAAPTTMTPDELPVAAVVGTPGASSVAKAAKVARAAKAATAAIGASAPASPLARQLVSLLKGGNAPALAVMLHEVFGPPKCKQHAPPPPEQPPA